MRVSAYLPWDFPEEGAQTCAFLNVSKCCRDAFTTGRIDLRQALAGKNKPTSSEAWVWRVVAGIWIRHTTGSAVRSKQRFQIWRLQPALNRRFRGA